MGDWAEEFERAQEVSEMMEGCCEDDDVSEETTNEQD